MRSFDVPEKNWNKAQQKIHDTKHDSMSEALRKTVNQIAQIETETQKQKHKLIQNSNLSKKQKLLVKKMLENQIQQKKARNLTKFAKQQNVYDRKDYVKRAVKKIDKSEIPYRSRSGGLKSEEIICENCDSKFFFHMLGKNNGDCLNCGISFVDIDSEEEKAFSLAN